MTFEQRLVPNQGQTTSLTTTPVRVLLDVPYGMKRTIFAITNTSTSGEVITVTLGRIPASSLDGLPLYANNSVWQSDGDAFQCSQLAVYVMSSTGTGQISFFEQLESVN